MIGLVLKNKKQYFEIADVGLGSIEMSRVKMNDSSSLKVRTYLSHGLPVILSSLDLDLENCPFVLNLKDESNLITMAKKIEVFLDKKIDQNQIVNFVNNNLLWEIKAREYFN